MLLNLAVVNLHLLEPRAIGIVHKIKSVTPGSLIAKDLVPFVVLKDKVVVIVLVLLLSLGFIEFF